MAIGLHVPRSRPPYEGGGECSLEFHKSKALPSAYGPLQVVRLPGMRLKHVSWSQLRKA